MSGETVPSVRPGRTRVFGSSPDSAERRIVLSHVGSG